MGNVVVCGLATLEVPSWATRVGLVTDIIVIRLGVLEDDVPCVEETGDVAKTAESEVDNGVSSANAHLDPDWRRKELKPMSKDGKEELNLN